MTQHQINLLPPERRSDLKKSEIWKKLDAVLARAQLAMWFMVFTGVILLALLGVLSVASSSAIQDELGLEVAEYKNIRRQVAEQKALFEQVHRVGAERMVWSDAFNEVFNSVPSGVTLVSLYGASTEEDGRSIETSLILKGQAVTRNVLQVFERQLQDIKRVAKIESPASNLLDRDNPLFEVKVLIENP